MQQQKNVILYLFSQILYLAIKKQMKMKELYFSFTHTNCKKKKKRQNTQNLPLGTSSEFTMLCNPSYYLVPEHFHGSQRKPCTS